MQTHILPREICGKSTFLVAMVLMKNLPVWVTDRLLVAYTYLTLGDTASVGIPQPSEGPMLIKDKTGKTPILDVGTFAAIKSGQVKVSTTITDQPSFQQSKTKKTMFTPLSTGGSLTNQCVVHLPVCAGETCR